MAIVFTCALVFIWIVTGLAVFSCLRFRASFYSRLLLAPTLGVALNVLVLFTLSRAGLPIKTFALELFALMLLASLYFLHQQRMILRRRSFILYCLFILVPILSLAEPLWQFGFEWLAFVNGDMSYYSVSSTRLLDYAYSELPISGNLVDLKDHSLMTWAFHNEMSYRTGSELLLAYLTGFTGLTAHQEYMPLLIAIHFCVASSAAALTLLGTRKWSFALWTLVLVVLSPMLTLEVTFQQLAQAIGLTMLTSLCVSYVKVMNAKRFLPWGIYSILAFSCLAVSYFEIIPFFVLYVFLYEAMRWKEWRSSSARFSYFRTLVIMLCGVFVLLNNYILSTVERILVAAKMSFENSGMNMHVDGTSTFPYFFVPSNGATLLGWMPYSGPENSVVIVLGLLATLLFTGLLFTSRVRYLASAQMTIVMLLVGVVLWIGGNAYGLLKIAMFIQPFLVSAFVGILVLFVTKNTLRHLGFTFIGLTLIPAQQYNISRVSGDIGSSPVPYASTAELGRQLRSIRDKFSHLTNVKIFSDTPSFELFSLETYYFKGVHFDSINRSLPLMNSGGEPQEFVFLDEGDGFVVGFRSKIHSNEYLLTTSNEFSIVNRDTASEGLSLLVHPISDFSNHLILMTRTRGVDNKVMDPPIYQLERDPLFSGGTFSAIGQYHVYEVLGPKEGSRMQISLSVSNVNQEGYLLPPVKVVGDRDTVLQPVGRGSARLISDRINPREIGSSTFMGIDFGRKAMSFDREKTGVMTLFGNYVKMDSRKVVGFSRGISYLAPEEYAQIKRPDFVRSIPAALKDPGLEYSGIFEDGWISEAAYVVLQVPSNSSKTSLRLRGLILDVDGEPFSPLFTIKINDRIVYAGKQGKGELDLMVPLDSDLFDGALFAKIQIESDALQRLPNDDGRPVSMLLKEVSFSQRSSNLYPNEQAQIKRPQSVRNFPVALKDPGLDHSGVFDDGWMADAAYVVLQSLPNESKVSLHLTGLIPDINGVSFTPLLTIKVNDEIVYTGKQDKGEVDIMVPLSSDQFNNSSIAKVQIESDALQRLPDNDGRSVSMLLKGVWLE